ELRAARSEPGLQEGTEPAQIPSSVAPPGGGGDGA
ncbi:MAG: hypothetical protein QOI18_1235, partial [Solirubrobacteraceae bacterium]|nr:hypothetical protein [Solirubrobacteraceae bacterium]